MGLGLSSLSMLGVGGRSYNRRECWILLDDGVGSEMIARAVGIVRRTWHDGYSSRRRHRRGS